jgi:cystine transport system substrate-binding protein
MRTYFNPTENLFISARRRILLLRTVVRSSTVLGQAPMPQRQRLLLLIVAALAVLVAPAVGGANPSQSVTSLRAHDASIEAKSRAAVLGLYSLDQRLSTAQANLAALQRQTVSLRAQRLTLLREQRLAQNGAHLSERRLDARVRTLYEQGTVSSLEVILGAKSLDEAVSSIDNLDNVNAQSHEILHQFARAKTRLHGASRALATRASALAAATAAAQATTDYLARTRDARNTYISSLTEQRRLTQQQIAGLQASARAAATRSAELLRVRESAPTPAPVSFDASPSSLVPPSNGRFLTVTATGYALAGHTATGLPVGWGVVAVDPSVIPLGTHLSIPGYGEAVAADTGGAVVGDTIDLWFPTVEQADAWGRRTVTVVLH